MHDGIEKLAGVHGMERVCRVNAFEGEENGKKHIWLKVTSWACLAGGCHLVFQVIVTFSLFRIISIISDV